MDRLARENELLRGVSERLVDAGSREDIETGVCEQVASLDGVAYAWFGTRRMTGDAVVQRAAAGDPPTPDSAPGKTVTDGLLVAAVENRHPLREGRHTAVPLVWNDALYGVLFAVGADANALSEEFVDTLSDLGSLVAAALASVERRRRLRAGHLVELDLHVSGYDAFPYDATRDFDCVAELNGFTAERRGYLVYFHVTGPDATPEFVRRVADDDLVRVVDAREDDCTVEVARPPDSVLGALADVGATLADATVENGTARLTARLAPGAAIPAVVDRLDAIAPDVTLVSKHETPRDIGRSQARGVFDALTDRQYAVLTAAYHAGYFDWPRASSGEDLADRLDVAPTTFYQHLRAAERNLLEELLDGE